MNSFSQTLKFNFIWLCHIIDFPLPRPTTHKNDYGKDYHIADNPPMYPHLRHTNMTRKNRHRKPQCSDVVTPEHIMFLNSDWHVSETNGIKNSFLTFAIRTYDP